MTDHSPPPHIPIQGSVPVALTSTTPATTTQASNLQAPPVMDPTLQVVMAAFFASMPQQFQAQAANAQPANPPDQPQYQATPWSRIKTRDPNPYDRLDPTKLCSFLSQCKLVFRSQPDEYREDFAKIMFAVSWLKGMAQHWFEPNLALEEYDLPHYACEWESFEEALNSTFREPDPIASATHKLDNLIMKDYHHLNKYNVDFNEYTTLTRFNKQALYVQYYKGLAPRIKDGLVYSSRPPTLAQLCEQAQELDLCYWEQKDKEKFATSSAKASGSSSSKATVPTSATSSSSKTTGYEWSFDHLPLEPCILCQ